jgi:hypothetical protein
MVINRFSPDTELTIQLFSNHGLTRRDANAKKRKNNPFTA